eukprot:jgi/Psemu1/58745/gm1.58745_g
MKIYSEYFQATASLFGNTPADRNEAYSTIYGYFAEAKANNTLLLNQLLDLFEAQAVGALGIFVADPVGESCLRLVHGRRKYPGPLAQSSLNKGKVFGYLDDIKGDAGELVQVTTDMLSKTPASRVLSLGHHTAELDAQLQRPYIPAVLKEGAAHSEMISAHKAFFGLGPWQAMWILYHQLSHHGLVVGTCAPLFDTVRVAVASTFPTAPAYDLTLTKPGPSFRSEPGLAMYMKNKVLYRDIPGLDSPPIPPGDPVLTAAVTALTDHQLKLSEGLDQKHTEAGVHPSCSLGPLVHQALVAALWEAGGIRPSSHLPSLGPEEQAPEDPHDLPEPTVLKRLQDCNFDGTDPFDREQEAAVNVVELQKTKAYILLESYLAVLATILGATHAVVEGYQHGLLWLKLQQMPLRRAIADEMGDLIIPAIVVYYFDISVRAWLEEQWNLTSPSPPLTLGRIYIDSE